MALDVEGVIGGCVGSALYRCRGRKCGRNVGFWVYTVGVPDIEMEIPE
jgi:hypothetical protein